MKKRNLLLSILFLLTICVQAFSQNQKITITGKVSNAQNNAGLEGATISVKSGNNVGTTKGDGTYTVNVPSGTVTLVFSHSGFTSFEADVNNRTVINVSMTASAKDLDEVVVVGYQTVRRKDLTGAVSSVDAKDIKDIPVTSAQEALEGRLAGVRIVMNEGAPGSDAVINIRGIGSITQNGSPLYVVDGIQIENAINTIAPQDIESITVLKDASATAIYGARGSNGVILITTKGGRNTQGRMTVTYNGSVGWSKLPHELAVLHPYDYVLFQWERAKFTGDTSTISRYTRNMSNFDTIVNYQNTPFQDWQNVMMGRTAMQQTHNVSLTGGDAKTQYNLSLTANDQDGIVLYTGYKRKIASFRFDHTPNDKVKFGFNFRYNDNTQYGASTSDPGSAGANNLRQYVQYRPLLIGNENDLSYDPNLYVASAGNGLNLINPLQNAQGNTVTNRTVTYDMNGYFNYNLAKGLSFRSTIGYDYYNLLARHFYDTITIQAKTYSGQPTFQQTTNNRTTIDNSNVFTYINPSLFGNSKNNLTVIAGEETYQTVNTDNYLELRYFPIGTSPDIAYANYALASAPAGIYQPKPTSDNNPVNNLSFFSRINYTFDRKYLFTVTGRADGSSLFAGAQHWGYFPSGSAAWRFSDENFMKNIKFLTEGKLRLSYGTTGNNRITPYSYLNGYNVGNGYGINNALSYTLVPTSVEGNPSLVWESTTSKNAGLDLSFFQNRVSLTLDVYSNTTKNLLVSNPVPSSSGYTNQLQNLGSTRNNGVEIQLAATVIRKRNFSWNVSYNMSFNNNIILSLGGLQTQQLYNSGWFAASNPADYIVKVGQQVGSMYGFVNDGMYRTSDFTTTPYTNASTPLLTTQYTLKAGVPNVYPGISTVATMPGIAKYKDLNGDGVVDSKDVTVIGHAQPKFIGGFNQQFTYKSFDASVFLNFSYGNQIYNANKIEFTNDYTNDANVLALVKDRWHNIDGQGNAIQAQVTQTVNAVSTLVAVGAAPAVLDAANPNPKFWIPQTGGNGFYPSSFAIEDGSFLRINNVTIGYSLPSTTVRKIGFIKSMRFYVTGNNLAVLTSYSGYDPEANTRRATPVTPGVDYSAYPRSRTFLVGVNASF